MAGNNAGVVFRQFDKVKIKTTKNVTFLTSENESDIVTPLGGWSVLAEIKGSDLLLSKGLAVCRIPKKDVIKIAEYNPINLDGLKETIEHGKKAPSNKRFGKR